MERCSREFAAFNACLGVSRASAVAQCLTHAKEKGFSLFVFSSHNKQVSIDTATRARGNKAEHKWLCSSLVS